MGVLEGLLAAIVGAMLQEGYDFLRAWLADRRAAQAHQDVGRLTAERDQASEGERVNAALADQAGKRVNEDDAIKRLERGDA